jgi:predicted dehydrogenase
MTNSIRVGVVGAGYLGSIHARIYSDMPDVELVGVFDTDVDRATSVAKEVDSVAVSSIEELIQLVDAVSIAVPTSLHHEIAEPFIKAGKALLIEKPVTSTVQQARKLVDLVDEHASSVLVGHVERYAPALLALDERITKPRFIEVHRLSKFSGRATDVDVITDLMIHDIDIILSIFDEMPNRVDAVGSAVITARTDIANVRLQFPCGAVANVTASRVSQKQFRRMRVFGPEGYFAVNFTDQVLDSACMPAGGKSIEDLRIDSEKVLGERPLQAELAHFAAVVRGEVSPKVTIAQGLRALEVVEMIQKQLSDVQI